MNKADIAWFAGFFEGEGCVRLGSQTHKKNGRDYGTPILDICQVNKEPLSKCVKIFPDSHLYGPYKYSNNRQPHYKFTVCGRDNIEGIFRLIKPYLSVKRCEQFSSTFIAHDKLQDRPRLKSGPKPKKEEL